MTTDNTQIFASIAAAGESNDFAARFPEGSHVVALNHFEPKDTTDYGRIISVDFVVVSSTNPKAVGTAVGEGFFISMSDAKGGKASKQRVYSLAKAAVQSLGGDPDDATPVTLATGQQVARGVMLVQSTMSEMAQDKQPWRGIVLKADATAGIAKVSKAAYTRVKYTAIAQTIPQIQAMRAKLESADLAAASASAPQVAAAPAPAAPPATSLLGG